MADHLAFIKANTRLISPPLVPEIQLHLADKTTKIWEQTEVELHQRNIPPPFWAFAWAGGQAVARHILDNEDLTDQRVFDFGAGGGLCAIAASLKSAARIDAFEIDPLALPAIEANALANQALNIKASLQNLLEHPEQRLKCDILLAADVFYEKAPATETLAFLQHQASNGIRVIAGDPERQYFPQNAFKRLATFDVPVDPDLEGVSVRRTSVWEL